MSTRIRYYKLTEWALVKRWLLIFLTGLLVLAVLYFIVNIKVTFCPGRADCSVNPKHSISNILGGK